MGYKYSLFTKRVVINTQSFVYNSFSDILIATDKDLDAILKRGDEGIDYIRQYHKTFFNILLCGKVIVNTHCEEWKEVASAWEKEDKAPEIFTIIINPTLNCNMRCWYCYEEHKQNSYIDLCTIQSVKRLISAKVSDKRLKGLNLDFFGGEPLLNYKNGVLPILEYAYTECINNNVELYVSFTTNGYLLTDEIRNELSKYSQWGKIKLQITLDGNKFFHDRTRKIGRTGETYDRIVSNIKKCSLCNYFITVRCNYTSENIISFFDVVEDFAVMPKKSKNNLCFSLHKVWQSEETVSTRTYADALYNAIKKAGIKCDPLVINHSRCYGDKENSVVINFNGDVYKCTAREFDSERRDGVLKENGLIEWNDKYKKRMSVKYGHDVCHHCFIYPLCHAGCSQNKLEDDRNTCIRNYTEDQKMQLIQKRIILLLEEAHG